jgi:hypothetical protein
MIVCPIQKTVTGHQIKLECHQFDVGTPDANALIRYYVLADDKTILETGEITFTPGADWATFATNFNTWGWLFAQVKAKAGIMEIPDAIPEASIIEPTS